MNKEASKYISHMLFGFTISAPFGGLAGCDNRQKDSRFAGSDYNWRQDKLWPNVHLKHKYDLLGFLLLYWLVAAATSGDDCRQKYTDRQVEDFKIALGIDSFLWMLFIPSSGGNYATLVKFYKSFPYSFISENLRNFLWRKEGGQSNTHDLIGFCNSPGIGI